MKQLIISDLSGTAATTLADLTGVTAKLGAIYLPDRTERCKRISRGYESK